MTFPPTPFPPTPSHLRPSQAAPEPATAPAPSGAISECIASPYCVPAQGFHSFRCETFQRLAASRVGDDWDRRSRYEEALREKA